MEETNMSLFSLMPLAASTSSAPAGGDLMTTLWGMSPLLLVVVVFYFLMIRPQRKREKTTTSMRNNVQVGDEITTVGGVMGRIVSIKDDSLIIETGADRNKMRVKKWAVQSCDTIHDDTMTK
jgi:preprotein translocase subunit YajC